MFNDKYSDKLPELKSEFNEAKNQIYRLNELWITCNESSMNGDLNRWKHALDAIYRELATDMRDIDKKKKDEPTKYHNRIKIVNLAIARSTTRIATYNALQKKEILLRNLQDEAGKGSKKSAVEQDDFLE